MLNLKKEQGYMKYIPVIILMLLVLVLYFKLFFTQGIYFDDVFLKKQVINNEIYYTGRSTYGDMNIIIRHLNNNQDNVDVIFKLPNNINKQYTVILGDKDYWGMDIKSIKDESGNIIFEGAYQKKSKFMLDKNGEIVIDNNIRILVNGETPYNAEYQIPLWKIAEIASFSDEVIRGRYPYLIFSIFIFIITWIEIKYPLLFFRMKHALSVDNPEPSELYITIQRIGWYIYPVIGIVFLVMAVV